VNLAVGEQRATPSTEKIFFLRWEVAAYAAVLEVPIMMAIISAGTGTGRVVGSEQSKDKDSSTLVLRREFPPLGTYVAPRTPIEQKLADIFCNVLGMDQVSA
jgi:hypothetical protein